MRSYEREKKVYEIKAKAIRLNDNVCIVLESLPHIFINGWDHT